MAQKKRTRLAKGLTSEPLQDLPFWFDPQTPLGSATRYIASSVGECTWVAISRIQGRGFQLASSVGSRRGAGPELVVPIPDTHDKIVGQIQVECHSQAGFDAKAKELVNRIAQEIGKRWNSVISSD